MTESKKSQGPETADTTKAVRLRISKDIAAEVKRFGEVLREAGASPSALRSFLERPSAVLEKAGVVLDKYASKSVPTREIESDIVQTVAMAMERNLAPIIGRFNQLANTYSSRTDTSYEYNFDHSTSTDYKYESHTGTSRGTFSETSSGTATDTHTSFSGRSMKTYLELVAGPLISPAAMKEILEQVETTLVRAAEQKGR